MIEDKCNDCYENHAVGKQAFISNHLLTPFSGGGLRPVQAVPLKGIAPHPVYENPDLKSYPFCVILFLFPTTNFLPYMIE